VVSFDGIQAVILSADENLLTCLAPLRPDLKEKTVVTVEVCNCSSQYGRIEGDKKLEYTYLLTNDSQEGNNNNR
jgi:hypothetical protein